jgi:hypothetical protein
MAYGTDTSHEPHEEHEDGVTAVVAPPLGLHDRLARLEERGVSATELKTLREDIEALEAKLTAATGTR